MARVTFQRGCMSCRSTDGEIHMIWWSEEAEYQLYRDVMVADYLKGDDENDEFSEDVDQSRKYITKNEMSELIAGWHMDTEQRCDFCGNMNCFDFWDIKINDDLLEDYDVEDSDDVNESEQVNDQEEEVKKVQKTELQKLNLKENVKSIKEISFSTKEETKGIITKGHKERQSSFSLFGNDRKSDFLYVFNKEGNKIEETYYNSDGRIDTKKAYKYDNEGHLIEVIFYDANEKIIGHLIYTFNSNGKCIEGKYFNPGNVVDSTVKYAYDERGNRIEEAIYTADGELHNKDIFLHDVKGRVTEYNSCDSEGNIGSRYYYEYDKRGNKIEEVQQNRYGLNTKYLYKYDQKGNRIEKRMYDSDRKLVTKWVYKYDNQDNLIEWDEFEPGIDYYHKFTYKYEYDKFNNWVKRIDFIGDNMPNYLLERTIEYF